MLNKTSLKFGLKRLGIEPRRLSEAIDIFSLRQALAEQGLQPLAQHLEKIVPDITGQYSREQEWSEFWELKVRGLHAFQCSLMLKALEGLAPGKITVVDIGDSAGTHMLYLQKIAGDKYEVDAVSVNLDSRAVAKIQAKGLKAMLCRAEDLDLMGLKVDLCTSFEMVEHLHNPAIFFRRLAKNGPCNRMLITVPYLKRSRVGLHNIRNRFQEEIYAEDEHIFELSPEDWELLLLHSGWQVVHSQIYRQYPRNWPIMQRLLAGYWRKRDYEGFWGVILQRDLSFSNRYLDWEE